MSASAFAHTGDFWGGGYTTSYNQKNLRFMIYDGAQTSILTEEVYKSATRWNDYADVNVSIVMRTPGMPSMAGYMGVYALTDDVISELIYYGYVFSAVTLPFDSQNKRISEDDNWDHVMIYMNTEPAVVGTSEQAKKTFTHEVGHALKLCHPDTTTKHSGHTIYYNGRYYPKSIMNQGEVGQANGAVTSEIALHDIENLYTKWGAKS